MMTDDLKALGREFTFPAAHRKGETLLQVVFADPGTNGFYYRERMPDSVAAYVRADIHAAALDRIAELEAALQKIADAKPVFSYVKAGPGGIDFDEPGSPYDRGKQKGYTELQTFARAVLTSAPTGQEGA